VARSRLTFPILGTLAYALFVAIILVVPTSAPHPHRGYLADHPPVLGRRFVADIAVNIAIFVPLGWCLHRTGRALGLSPRAAVAGAVAGATLFSVSMETLQFWLPARYSSIVDVVANSAGALLGAWSERRAADRA
jgi:VanZ family protein